MRCAAMFCSGEQLKNVTIEATSCKNNLANTQVLNEMDLANRLLEASYAGRIDEVKALLKLNASLKSTNELGYTPLLCAAANAHLEIVEELFQAGANVTDLSRQNETVLHLVLARKDNEWDPEQDNLAQLFIRKGANISAQTKDGDTPLHVAARYNRHKMVKVLLDEGQDVSVINKVNNTPLHEAAKYNALKSICLLMKEGANPKAVNKQNKTSLDFTEGKPDVKDYIVNHNNYVC